MQAYRGDGTFKDATGRFDKLLADNKSNTFPWFINYRRSKVTTGQTNTMTCNVYRDFETTWTEIQLHGGKELTMNLGYYVYPNQNELSTTTKGSITDYKLKVLDAALTCYSASLTAALLLSASYLL